MSYFTELGHQYIDGEWRSGSGSWDIIDFNPFSGEKLATIPVATVKEIDAAYEAAERAQEAWAATNPYRRRAVLDRAVRLLEERADKIIDVLTQELGGTRAKGQMEIDSALDTLRHASSLAVRADGEILPAPHEGRLNRLRRKPVGVVSVISPYNYPFAIALLSVAPALALGNAVVVKPHQNSPISGGGLVARLFEDAGLPPGLLNTLVTDIAEIGDAFIEHPVPSVISFTGTDRIGRHVATVAARHFKRTVMQLSGGSAFVVLDDVRGKAMDYAVRAAVASRFIYQGQICMAANRILVDRAVEREFTEKFVAAVAALRVGDPADPETHIGPLINSLQVEAIEQLVGKAVADGVTVLLRGSVHGNLVEPTVLTDVAEDSPLMRQEIFGPVALLVPFDGDDEAVRLANLTPYGLSGAVHTADAERGVRLGRRVRTGMFHVNNSTVLQDATVPFGGEGLSGMGRLGGDGSVDAFTTMQWISVQEGEADFPL